MDIHEIADRMEEELQLLEGQLTMLDPVFHKMAVSEAFRRKKMSSKLQLLYAFILKKLGIIPTVSVDEYRKDFEIRQKIRQLKGDILVLENRNRLPKSGNVMEDFPAGQGQEEKIAVPKKLQNGYIAILVETLDVGGVEQIVELLACEFVKRKISVRVLCLKAGGETADKLRRSGIPVCVFCNNTHEFKRYIMQNRPLLINTHFVKRHIRFLWTEGIPVIEVIHNMYVFFSPKMVRVERKNESYYTKMIAVSEIVKETYLKRIKQTDKIAVIGNAAVLRKTPERTGKEIRTSLGIPSEAYVLLNVGSIAKRKNQLGILYAFEILKQLVNVPLYLVFAGNIQDDEYKNQITREVAAHGLRNEVIILPYYDTVRELYRMADVLVVNSYYEGWSVAATEALLDGLPLIHSQCGSARELVCGGRYGKVVSNPAGDMETQSLEEIILKINRCESENIKELVEAVLDMIDNREMWTGLRSQIAAEAKRRFSTEAMCGNYLKAFSDVI